MENQIRDYCEAELKEQIVENYSKLEDIDTYVEKFEAKDYLKDLNLSQARIEFKLRSRMLEVKNNFKRN